MNPKTVLCGVLTAAVTLIAPPGAAAQERAPAIMDRASNEVERAQIVGKLRGAFEARTTVGRPYSGEAVTEFVQSLADGNRIARRTVTRVYRDADGRVRREHLTADGQVEAVTVVDPVARTSMTLEPRERVAYGKSDEVRFRRTESRRAMVTGEGGAPPPPPPAPIGAPGAIARKLESGGASREQTTREDLGQRTLDGLSVRGTRTTTVIHAGAIGNDQPIRIVSEEWFSPDLELLVLTKHSDPRSGETTYTLSNIVRAEPDRSLFEVPADYTRK
jgi:hypothetical protein